MIVHLNEKAIETALSKIQSTLADAQELIIAASNEIDILYIELSEKTNIKKDYSKL